MTDEIIPEGEVEDSQRQHTRFELFDTATMDIDGASHKCSIINLSVGGAAVVFEVALEATPPFGKTVMLDIDGLGKLNGYVTRSIEDGVAVHLNVSARQQDMLAALMMKGLNDILFADEDA